MDDASFAHMGYCSGFFSVVFRMQLKKEESANVSDAGSRGARETEGRHPDEGSLPSFRCGLSPTGLRFVFSRHTRVSPGLLLLAHPRASVPQNERRTFTIVRLRSAPGPVEYVRDVAADRNARLKCPLHVEYVTGKRPRKGRSVALLRGVNLRSVESRNQSRTSSVVLVAR